MTLKRTPKIVMVGSAMVDLVTRVPRLPVGGETLVGSSFDIGFGGKGSNQAVMAARLGAQVSVVAKLGRDVFGEQVLENYRKQSIDTTHVSFVEGSSGVAPIMVDEESGQNIVVIVPGANNHLSVKDVEAAAAVIEKADILIGQLEIPVQTTLAAFELAQRHGVTTLLNPAPAAELPDALWHATDTVVPNEIEAAQLSNLNVANAEDAIKAARALQHRGPQQVVVTLGSQGAVVLDADDNAHYLEARKVKAVDTTGAGDAFVGSLAYFLGLDYSLADAAQRAGAVATLSVQKAGTQTSYPSAEEVAEAGATKGSRVGKK